MNIQPITQNNISSYGSPTPPNNNGVRRFINNTKQKVLDILPNKTLKGDQNNIDKWNKISDKISRPAENKIIVGTSALILQPTIDMCNHKVDKETKKVSILRTISKILAGTIVGLIVRGGSYKLVQEMTKIDGVRKYSQSLLAKDFIEEFKNNPQKLKNYINAVSNITAIAAMCITNFAVDAPFTKYLTNKFCKAANVNDSEIIKKEESNE
ncbi:MAG: hypothetical protein E7Z89_03065 [Cyanobacteria bacterium SIG28]|nr:hypothetical protein [Cyanobacteria bacterium SIG28]